MMTELSLLPVVVASVEKETHGWLSIALLCISLAWSSSATASLADEPFMAQQGLPSAPFVFMGEVLRIDHGYDSSRHYRIGEEALVDVKKDVAAVWRGTVSNVTGSRHGLVKFGEGHLSLAGANTYRGSTKLLQGGLEALDSRSFGQSSLYVNPGATLSYGEGVKIDNSVHILDIALETALPGIAYTPRPPDAPYADAVRWTVAGGVAEHAGALIGDASFVKQGQGLLVLSGDGLAYTGKALVEAGGLAVNDYLMGSVRVAKGARLQGVGLVGSVRIGHGGTLAPGNSVGTLRVRDDLHFEAGSRFVVDVQPTGEADAVHAGGKALLDGHVLAMAGAGQWQSSTDYRVLSADGGLDGTQFASVGTDLAFLTPALSYDNNTVTLTLTRNDVALDDVADTPDQKEAAQTVEQSGPAVVRDEIISSSRPVAREAFDQLAGSWAATLRSGLIDDSRFVREAVLATAGIGHGPWGRAFYASGHRKADSGEAGARRSISGFVTGGRLPLRQNLGVGAYIGAQQSRARRLNSATAQATIGGVHLGLNMVGQARQWWMVLGAAQTWHKVDADRDAQVGRLHNRLSSRYGAATTQVFGELAWRQETMGIEPFARLAWLRTRTDGFTERGGPAALDVQRASQHVLLSGLGARMHQTLPGRWSNVMMSGQLSWEHAGGVLSAMGRQRFDHGTGADLFQSQGIALARHYGALDLGVSASLAKGLDVKLEFSGRAGRGLRDYGGHLRIGWTG